MPQLLIAFAGEKTRLRMQEIFESVGVRPALVCGSGAEVLRRSARLDGGVVLCGYKLLDMMADELAESLGPGYSVVLLAPQSQLEMCMNEEICRLAAPAQKSELVETVQMLLGRQADQVMPPKRSDQDRKLIAQAKELLMERNQMSESQAHRFLQKRSMDGGLKMVQTAMLVLDGQLMIS